ncbi:Mor transcription activator family protein [Methylomonas rapida]|uniref:Mor transcription activator domain-containing protein n=1 Tax=Methylomonas rapida TaxID=2963939 RepID=A0ABY7GR29_9GAMM|nr:Mor transcription activator family protein [Methylomonas rapida]WAR46958.1 hypothetical protein NM686_010725 [Methylomonas rapida]
MNDDSDIYSQILREIQQSVLYFGIDADISRDMAGAITEKLRKLLSKHTVYFPEKPADRNAQIREAFNGCNREEVCEQFGISKATFYRAISERV